MNIYRQMIESQKYISHCDVISDLSATHVHFQRVVIIGCIDLHLYE